MQKKPKLTKAPVYRFLVFAEMLLCYILIYAGIQMVATLGTDIMEYLGISESQLGLFSALGSPSMAVMSVAAGAMAAKTGGKRVLMTGLLTLAASGALYLTGSRSLCALIAIRILQGFGTGMVSATVQGLVAVWFTAGERGTAQGALAAFYGASTSIVTIYASFMSARGLLWYETAGYMLLVCGLLFAVMIGAGYKDIEKAYGVNLIDEAIEGRFHLAEGRAASGAGCWTRPDSWSGALRHPAFWLVAVSLFFYGGSAFGLGFVLPLFLAESGYNASEQAAVMTYGSPSSIIFSLAGGVIADRVFHGRRTQVYAIAFGGAAFFTAITGLVGSGMSVAAMSLLYFMMMGFATFAGGPAWVLPVEVVGPRMAQQSMGACLLASGMGSTVMLLIYGQTAESFGAEASIAALACCMAVPCAVALILGKKYKI